MKRISTVLLFLFIFSVVALFGETEFNGEKLEILYRVEKGDVEDILPDTVVEIFVNYPDSQPVSYIGRAIANFDDAILISSNDKVFYIRKQFIQELVMLKETPSMLALGE